MANAVPVPLSNSPSHNASRFWKLKGTSSTTSTQATKREVLRILGFPVVEYAPLDVGPDLGIELASGRRDLISILDDF